jgi:hypothetical protein
MGRVAIVAQLKAGAGPRAAELIGEGPPFDLAEAGIVRHSVYLSSHEVVFVFEAPEVEWILSDLIDDPFHPKIQSALDRWRTLVDEPPRIARERFGWERDEDAARPRATVGSEQWA